MSSQVHVAVISFPKVENVGLVKIFAARELQNAIGLVGCFAQRKVQDFLALLLYPFLLPFLGDERLAADDMLVGALLNGCADL